MRQLLVADLLHEGLDLGVAQFGFGLPLELRIGDLHRNHSGQALSDVVAGKVRVLLFEDLLVLGVLVDHGGQCSPEPLLVRTALVGVDGVGEGVDGLGVAGVPLHRDLNLVAFSLTGEAQNAVGNRLLGAVDVLDEVD